MEGKAELAEEHNKVVRANFTILRDAMTEGRLTLLNAAVGDEFAVAKLVVHLRLHLFGFRVIDKMHQESLLRKCGSYYNGETLFGSGMHQRTDLFELCTALTLL